MLWLNLNLRWKPPHMQTNRLLFPPSFFAICPQSFDFIQTKQGCACELKIPLVLFLLLSMSEWEAVREDEGLKWFTGRMDFINSPQPCHWRLCPKYLFPPYFHWISTVFPWYFTGFSKYFHRADPTNRDILKGCRRLPQSGDLLRWVDNREKNRNRPLEGQTLALPAHLHLTKKRKQLFLSFPFV